MDVMRRKHVKRFSKTISLVLLVFTLIFALVGCATAPKQDLGEIVPSDVDVTVPAPEEPAPEEPAPEESAPAEEAPASEEQPVAEEEPVVEEEVAVTYVPVEKKYTLLGYELDVVAEKGKATITYPASIITESDIDTAAAAALVVYGSTYDLSGVYYDASQEGVLVVYYPEEWGMEELAVAEQVLMAELPAYVEYVVASYATPAEEEPAVEETAPVEEVAEEPAEELTYAGSISVFGYEADVKAYENIVEITYPSFITFDEIKAAAAAAYEAFPQYLEGSTLYVDTESATAVLTLAGVPSAADLSYAMDLVNSVLPAYVTAYLADNAEEIVTEVAEAVDEVAAEVEEKVAEIEEEGISATISLFGYEASITLKDDVITIDYPDFITVDEVKAAAAAAYEAYSDYLQGSVLTIDDGFATLKLSFKIGKDEFNYAVNLLESELSYYIATVLNLVTEDTTEETAEVETTEVAEVEETTPELYETSFTLFGQEVQIAAYGNTVGIIYPESITNAEVAAAAKAAYEAYSQYLDGSELTIDNGSAILTLGYSLTEDDFNYAVSLLQSEITYYLANMVVEDEKVEEVVETVTEVAQAISDALTQTTEEAPAEQPATEEPVVEEQPAAEEPVVEQPAAEPAKTETTTTTTTTEPAKTETTTTATAEPAKKSNTGLIVLIVVLVVVAAAAVVLFLKKKKN
jgi:gas vesicle protein